MRILKTRHFAKWAHKEGVSDELLRQTVWEMGRGLIGANLGGHVYKKRIALKGQGKRGGARVIVAYQHDEKTFFIFGYAKNERDNLTSEEQHMVKALAAELVGYSNEQLSMLIRKDKLFEVKENA